MKRIKFLSTLFFILTIVSTLFAIFLSMNIGEQSFFGPPGTIRYSWVMYFFLPFGFCSLFIGFYLRRKKIRAAKNFIVSFICIPILLIFGSYRFIMNDNLDYSPKRMLDIEAETTLPLPHDVKIATWIYDDYAISYAKILDSNEDAEFRNTFSTNHHWSTNLDGRIQVLIPIYERDLCMFDFEYFSFYNKTTRAFFDYNCSMSFRYSFFAYNSNEKRLMIIDNYYVSLD